MNPDLSTILQLGGTILAFIVFALGIRFKVENLEARRREDLDTAEKNRAERDDLAERQRLERNAAREQQIDTLRRDMEGRVTQLESRTGGLENRLGRGEEKFENIGRALIEIKTDLRVLLNRRRGDDPSAGNE